MLALSFVLAAAIVVEDHTALRASPHDSAPRQAELGRGDWVEVRGRRAEFLQVYDHRRERPGYVRAAQARTYLLDEKTAPQLAAVIDFLRDSPGSESLGIGYTALLLKAAPAGLSADFSADLYDALGTMADRLAHRASLHHATAESATIAAHLEVAQSYGVRFASRERGDETRLCYDGAAFRRLLSLGGTPGQRARAALALTAPECVDPGLRVAEAHAALVADAEILASVDPGPLPAFFQDRLRLRHASVDAALAFSYSRHDDPASAAKASEAAQKELALIDKAELLDEDRRAMEETTLRVAAARWAAEPVSKKKSSTVDVAFHAGSPGETCVALTDHSSSKKSPDAVRCTYSLVWPQSLRVSPDGSIATLAVQPQPSWIELWVFRRENGAWTADVLTPATTDPELGYVELAGFTPDSKRLLIVRAAKVTPAVGAPMVQRDFQIVLASTLAIEHHAPTADRLVAFRHSADPQWRGRSLALR